MATITSRENQKFNVTLMFPLVFGRHVGAHPDGHQHGVSIQASINLGKKISPHILLKKNSCDLNLGGRFCLFTFFLFSDCGLYLLPEQF